MAVLMSVGGSSSGDGFLVAPLGTTYEAEIALWTDAGNATVTLQASPNPAGLVFSTAAPINISPVKTLVTVHSTLQSASRGDTTIQVLDAGMAVVVSFNVTSIKHPVVNFKGRFEARFATDGGTLQSRPDIHGRFGQRCPAGMDMGARRGAGFRTRCRQCASEPRNDRCGPGRTAQQSSGVAFPR